MQKIIRIGTRESELALWQANKVRKELAVLGYESVLVPIKSMGDIVLDKPLYELGITGVFTKNLDIALLNNKIDIAVHSFKDVPTKLPFGIVQGAILKRGDFNDVLVIKEDENFFTKESAIIATGSLRRKAQWLYRYPHHTITGLRGNVNTRLQKLEDNDWDGAIFAAAGLKRLKLLPEKEKHIKLDWMIPAPAQGAVMVAVLDENEELKAIPADQVEKIEIITNPSAKYKAGGSANGVIEVYTKNFKLEGYRMSVRSQAGISTQLKPTGGLNLGYSYKKNKFTVNSYLGANYNFRLFKKTIFCN